MVITQRILFGLVGACLFLAMPVAKAQNAPAGQADSPKEHAGGGRIQGIFKQLNLTDDQKQKLEVNKQQVRSQMERIRKAIKEARQQLQSQLMSPTMDMAKVQEAHGQIKALQAQMEDDRLNSILAVRGILTPDQFLKFTALMRQHEANHGP